MYGLSPRPSPRVLASQPRILRSEVVSTKIENTDLKGGKRKLEETFFDFKKTVEQLAD